MAGDPRQTGEGDAVANNRAGGNRGHGLKERAIHEVMQFLIMFLYLFVLLGVFAIDRSIVLEQHNLSFAAYGFAFVNALVLAKVMLVAEDLHLGRRFEDSPLIYPVLCKSLLFALVLVSFHIVENVITGWWHGKAVLESIFGIGGGGIKGILSVGVIMFVVLIPFFAFREINRVLGSAALRTLLFERGAKDVVIELKLRTQDRS
jgi:hypothetical protein